MAKARPNTIRNRAAAPYAAAEFKAKCLKLMDRVRETGAEYVVTKHGRPVAKVVPYTEPKTRPLFGWLKGTVLQYERPFDPIDGDYDIDREACWLPPHDISPPPSSRPMKGSWSTPRRRARCEFTTHAPDATPGRAAPERTDTQGEHTGKHARHRHPPAPTSPKLT